MLDGSDVARSADGIPLDSFSPAAALTVLALFAVWGFWQVLLGSFCALALRPRDRRAQTA